MSEGFLHRYELIMYEMAKWIATQTWGGHEKDCALFAAPLHTAVNSTCTCIHATINEMHATIRACQAAPPPTSLPDFTPLMLDLQARVAGLTHTEQHLNEEIKRLQALAEKVHG